MKKSVPPPSSSDVRARQAIPRSGEPAANRDAATQLRARLLQMILANEQSRQSATADSHKPR